LLTRHNPDYELPVEDASASKYLKALDREEDTLRLEIARIFEAHGISDRDAFDKILDAMRSSWHRALDTVHSAPAVEGPMIGRETLDLDESWSMSLEPSKLHLTPVTSNSLALDNAMLVGIGTFADQDMAGLVDFSNPTDFGHHTSLQSYFDSDVDFSMVSHLGDDTPHLDAGPEEVA